MTINITVVPPRWAETAELDCVGDGVDADVVLVLVALDWALFWNAVKFSGELSTALIAKTMPDWQWPTWRQYAQTGLVSWTV